jgi:hypothetical protein
MKKLNNYLFQKRALKHLLSAQSEPIFIDYQHIKTVLLLFESDFSEKNPLIRRIIALLQRDGKKVSAWGYIQKKEVSTAILPDFRILHHKHIDFFDKPCTSFQNELDNLEFDLVIDLTLRPLVPLQYLLIYARSAFKAGIHHNDKLSLYNFILNIENNGDSDPTDESPITPVNELYVFNQIIFYLKSIQSND